MAQDNNTNTEHKKTNTNYKGYKGNNSNYRKKPGNSGTNTQNTQKKQNFSNSPSNKSTDGTERKKSQGSQGNFKKNYKSKRYSPRKPGFSRKPEYETADDIKRDITRIEKEIRLEIEEIKSMKI